MLFDLQAWVPWLFVALTLTAAWLARRMFRSLRARWRGRRNHTAELRAERLLERAGYGIEARQATRRWSIACDGEPVEVLLRADLLVHKHGVRYVADVKTGSLAPSLRTAATRRQLLEYWHAYDVDGVLLVDMEQERIHEVVFASSTQNA
jgi:hypothetical protein